MSQKRAVPFQPQQIVCLEYKQTYLYAEVVQDIRERQMCWVRPLCLKTPDHLTDLREGADIVWYSDAFRPALDTEVLPLLTELPTKAEPVQTPGTVLNQFMRQVWQQQHVKTPPHD
ncbi:hypothetical protein PN462_12045 [Spirulina sp. CS-785/01]|uniref:hypothetical protein n=1 Tax=Spirulina sp. CS-785/01 TaxID=3021716 RepID=UPI00232E0A24|nr:hypothetical protein [Spirulina sp. CS-785/01]MDB9313834.1 hypothetical protein [Spirulina sp. CS-785/01]